MNDLPELSDSENRACACRVCWARRPTDGGCPAACASPVGSTAAMPFATKAHALARGKRFCCRATRGRGYAVDLARSSTLPRLHSAVAVSAITCQYFIDDHLERHLEHGQKPAGTTSPATCRWQSWSCRSDRLVARWETVHLGDAAHCGFLRHCQLEARPHT